MRLLSLFSGGGGLDMAAELLWPDLQHVAFSELDPHAASVYSRWRPNVPNLGDITAIDLPTMVQVDVLTAGFPCQDISKAGRGAGVKEGTRSGLWFRVADAVRVLRPRVVLLENVAAITAPGRGLDVVLGSLAALGFNAQWGVLRASDVGAPHGRARWFCVAYPNGVRPVDVESDVVAGEARVETFGDVADRSGPPADPGSAGTGRDTRAVPRPATEGRRSGTDVRAVVHGRSTLANANVTRPQGASDGGLQAGRPAAGSGGEASWGEYADAVKRWQAIIGRPAPDPTDDNGSLSPPFVEWMMGWPQGHVAGLSRSQALKVLGNGVVPLQAAHAYRQLLDRIERTEVAA